MSDYQSRNVDMGTTGSGEDLDSGMSGSGAAGSGSPEQTRLERVQDMAGQARERLTGTIEELRGSATQLTRDMTDQMRSGMDRLRTVSRDDLNLMYDDVLETARLHPGRTILISAAVGMMLGMALRGGRRNY